MSLFSAVSSGLSDTISTLNTRLGMNTKTNPLMEGLSKLFGGTDGFDLSSLFSGQGLGLGSLVNKIMDGLGFPDIFGDIGGAVIDFMQGNIPGGIKNSLDALESLADADFDLQKALCA